MSRFPVRYGNRTGRNLLYQSGFMLFLLAAIGSASSLDEATVDEMIRRDFPEVSQIPPESLLVWQSKNRTISPFLLDVREPEEYAVSHLQGARRAVSDREALDILKAAPRDTLVVLYCSVGYRSSALADTLQRQGFTNVHNLEGSIFAWANRGLPVYRGNKQVSAVHPFDETWGQMLNRSLWATTPDSSEAK